MRVLLTFLTIVAGYLYIQPAKAQNSWWLAAFPQDIVKQSQFTAEAQKLKTLLSLSEQNSFHEKVDAVRHLIDRHSIHKIDQEFYSYWGNLPLLMNKIHQNFQNSGDKPHMECATRSAVMYHILRLMDIRTRAVVIYPGDNIQKSHTYLEVCNPDTSKWEIQDPDHNLYWISNETGMRASTQDLLTDPIKENFLPCRDENDCGYTKREKDKFIKKFALASVIDIDAGYNPLILNADRFDPDHPFLEKKNPMAYCALFKDGTCHSEIIKVGEHNDGTGK